MGMIIQRGAVVSALLLVVGYQLLTVFRCVRARPRKWKLALLALVGAFHIQFNWDTGVVGVNWFSATLLGGSVDWISGMTIVGVSLPAGALLASEILARAQDTATGSFLDRHD